MYEQNIELKRKLLNMLSWFHNFCQEHGMRYYVIGGTMLGAARHQGFIPWDDDIDVGMPRSDYRRLEELLKDYKGRYILETPHTTNKDYFYPMAKLYDTETTLIENTRYKIKRGIYLDIFPLDGVGDSEEESFEFYKKVKFRRYLLLTLTTGIRKGRSIFKNLATALMRVVPDCVLSKKKLLLSLDKLCAQKDFDQCEWVGNLVGNWMNREIMPYRYFGQPQLYVFEEITVFGVQEPDAYLTALYGDWKKLPPIEKQKSHHDFLFIDLNTPYVSKMNNVE